MFGELPFSALPFSTCLGIYTVVVSEQTTAQDNPYTGAEALWRPIETSQTPDWEIISTLVPDTP